MPKLVCYERSVFSGFEPIRCERMAKPVVLPLYPRSLPHRVQFRSRGLGNNETTLRAVCSQPLRQVWLNWDDATLRLLGDGSAQVNVAALQIDSTPFEPAN